MRLAQDFSGKAFDAQLFHVHLGRSCGIPRGWFGAWGLGFGVRGVGFGAWGLGFWFQGFGLSLWFDLTIVRAMVIDAAGISITTSIVYALAID